MKHGKPDDVPGESMGRATAAVASASAIQWDIEEGNYFAASLMHTDEESSMTFVSRFFLRPLT